MDNINLYNKYITLSREIKRLEKELAPLKSDVLKAVKSAGGRVELNGTALVVVNRAGSRSCDYEKLLALAPATYNKVVKIGENIEYITIK